MASDSFVIGVDFGTDSVRSIVVNAANGNEVAASIFYYPRWKKGLYCAPADNLFRQHPSDYIEGLTSTIIDCLNQCGADIAANVKGISIDTTGSTPVAVDKTGTPLALLNGFGDNPNAMFVLWKDHTAVKEAAELNLHATKFATDYLQFVGGIYSSEWYWAKLLHVLREDAAVRDNIYAWVEHCDWIPYLLTGGNDVRHLKRGVCSAGHKSLWAADWSGLPPADFFVSWDNLLKGIAEKPFTEVYTSAQPAGKLSEKWAAQLGLSTDVVIGIGAFDCHMGAVGGQIEPYYLSKVMGTSTCDMLVAPIDEVAGKTVRGICGQVPGSIIPGMMGMEAGQSAFGDAYAWFRNLLAWPLENIVKQTTLIDPATAEKLCTEINGKILAELSKQAAAITLHEDDELALDWLNGRRTPDANQLLKGAFTGLDLASDAPKIFRSLVEATCFGARKIVDRFRAEGIPVKGLIGMGGVAKRAPFVMQMMADIMNMPIRIHKSEQTCALGAAMFAATAAGIYAKVEDAMAAMGQGFEAEYHPDAAKVNTYEKRYQKYSELGAYIEQKTNL